MTHTGTQYYNIIVKITCNYRLFISFINLESRIKLGVDLVAKILTMQFAYAMSIVMIEIGCGIWSNAYYAGMVCHMPHD